LGRITPRSMKLFRLQRVRRHCPGRTWIISPDAASLNQRWRKLIRAKTGAKGRNVSSSSSRRQAWRQTREQDCQRAARIRRQSQAGCERKGKRLSSTIALRPIAHSTVNGSFRIAVSSIKPNPELWRSHSDQQVYLTAPSDRSPTVGPRHCHSRHSFLICTITTAVAARVLFRFGVTPRRDPSPILPPNLLERLSTTYKTSVSAEDFLRVSGRRSGPIPALYRAVPKGSRATRIGEFQ